MTNLTIDDIIIQDCILISEGHLNTCAKFQRNTWSKTYLLTNGIFRNWSTNLTVDDAITQERAIVFLSITVQNFKSIELPKHGHCLFPHNSVFILNSDKFFQVP